MRWWIAIVWSTLLLCGCNNKATSVREAESISSTVPSPTLTAPQQEAIEAFFCLVGSEVKSLRVSGRGGGTLGGTPRAHVDVCVNEDLGPAATYAGFMFK